LDDRILQGEKERGIRFSIPWAGSGEGKGKKGGGKSVQSTLIPIWHGANRGREEKKRDADLIDGTFRSHEEGVGEGGGGSSVRRAPMVSGGGGEKEGAKIPLPYYVY